MSEDRSQDKEEQRPPVEWVVADLDDAPRQVPITGRELGLLALITLLAGLMRLWRLDLLPPGIHVDEAFNILDARAVAGGWRPVFLPANAGRDVLYTYLQAPLVAAFGESIGVARLASALIGTLSVPLFWITSRRLIAFDPEIDGPGLRRAALLTAALTAFSYWHLHFSRFGIRAVLFPVVVCGTVWAWLRVLEVDSEGGEGSAFPWRELAQLAGFLGLAFYTHPAGRALIALPLLHLAWLWWRERDLRPVARLGISAAGALILALPLIRYWWQHPETFTSHAAETSILGQGAGGLLGNGLRVLGMFFVSGDPAAWRNFQSQAVLGPLWPLPDPGYLALATVCFAALFLFGLWHVWRAALARESWAMLIIAWLVVLSLPTVITDAAPNFSRAIGILPLPFLFAALGLERCFRFALRRRPELDRRRFAALSLSVAGLMLGATFVSYFWFFPTRSESALAFDDDKVALARFVDATQAEGIPVYLSQRMAEHPTLRVLADSPLRGFDRRHGLVLPPPDVDEAVYALLPSVDDADQLGWLGRLDSLDLSHALELESHGGLRPELGEHEIQVLRVRPDLELDDAAVDFDGYIRLHAIDLSARAAAPGDTIQVVLTWEAVQPTETDLNTAIQIVDPQGEGIAQADGPPLGGSYATDRWRPGEIVISEHSITIPADAKAGGGILRVGWYDWRSETAAPLTDDRGESVVDVAGLEIVAR